MGEVGDQVIFPVGFIFDGLFVPLHGGFDLDGLCGDLGIGRRKNIIRFQIMMHIGMDHGTDRRDDLAAFSLGIKMCGKDYGQKVK